MKKFFEEKQKKAGEFVEWLKKFRELLGLAPLKIIWNLEPAYCSLFKCFLAPILWFEKDSPLAIAIHESRHQVQVEKRIPLLTENDLKKVNLSFSEKEKREIEVMRKHGDPHLSEEIDAMVVAKIGERLVNQNKIEEFKKLMLFSEVTS